MNAALYAETKKTKSMKRMIKGAAVASVMLASSLSPAHAIWQLCGQGPNNSHSFSSPIRPGTIHVDDNGVDIALGSFSPTRGPTMSIGDPENGGMVYSVKAGAGGENWQLSMGNYNASITKKKTNSTTDAGYYQVNGLNSANIFTLSSGGTFTAEEGTGATLTRTAVGTNGYNYTYTSSDGTVTEFGNSYSGEPAMFAGYEGQVGLITSQTKPDGEKLTWSYQSETLGQPKPHVGNCAEDVLRLGSVTSNYGYSMVMDYESDTVPTTAGSYNDWITPTKTTLYNLSVLSSSYSGDWPEFTYTGDGNARLESITDAEGGVTTFTYTSGYEQRYVEKIKLPGSTVDDIVVTYELDTTLSLAGEQKPRVTSVTLNGETWDYAYSDSGSIGSTNGATRTVTVTDPSNNDTVYVSKMWMINPVYSLGDIVTFERLKIEFQSVKDPLNRTTSFEYDSYSRKTKVTLPEGNYITFTYDSRGNVTETRLDAKSGSGLADIVTSATFPSSCTNTKTCNKPITTTDALGNVTNYTYDSNHGGVLTEKLPDPDGAGSLARPETRYTYAQKQARYYTYYGSTTLKNGDAVYMLTETSVCSTGSSCDGAAAETISTNAWPTTSSLNNLELLSITTEAGNGNDTAMIAYAYDEWTNRIEEDGPLSGTADTTRTRYNDNRQVIGVIAPDPDAGGARKHMAVKTTYNSRGLPSTVERGTVNSQSDADWASFSSLEKTETTYDSYGRVASKIIWDGSTKIAVRQYSYDDNSRLECSTRRMNPAAFSSLPASACSLGTEGTGANAYGPDRITKTVYDAAGQVTKTIKAYLTSVEVDDRVTTYTNNGLIATLADPNNNKTTYEYDGHDRLIKLRFPSKTTAGTSAACSTTYQSTDDCEQYAYDAAGNITDQRLRDGTEIDNTYDDLNRITLRDAPGTTNDVTYAYDNNGLRTSESVPSHAMTYAYDALGRLTEKKYNAGFPVQYEYDAASRLTEMTHPDGFEVDYTWDTAGNPKTAAANGATLATVTYDDLQRRTSVDYGNGADSSYAYDAISRLTDLDWDVNGSADDVAYDLSYNPAWQLTTLDVAPNSLLWTPALDETDSYSVNGLNQYTVVAGQTITHDKRGNITTDHRGRTYSYDVDNRLLTVASLPSGTASYAYYPEGNLREKSYNSTVSKFYYDDTQEIYETDGLNIKLRRYIRLPGSVDEPFLMIDYTLDGSCTNTSFAKCEVWAHQDQRGSVVATTDDAGDIFDLYTYSAYGSSGTEGDAGFPFRFTGQKLDADAGLYYYKARWYDPATGRFMQTDPIWYEDQTNLYGYVHNDPVNLWDPFGEKSYLVSRPIGETLGFASHTFIVVTDDDTGDVVERFSYGPSGREVGGRKLVSLTGSETKTDRDDLRAWNLSQSNPEKAKKEGIGAVELDIPDEAILAAGHEVNEALGTLDNPGSVGYNAITTPKTHEHTANSNSATQAVQHRATEIGGGTVSAPSGRGYYYGFGEYTRIPLKPNGQKQCQRLPEHGGCD